MVLAFPGHFARPLACFCILGLAVAAPVARAGTDPLPLAEALKIGEKVSPRLAAQGAALAAATELVPRASELPDPKLRVGVDNLPVNGADRYRYDSDFMTMRKIGVMQDFPNAEKRRLRGERACAARRRGGGAGPRHRAGPDDRARALRPRRVASGRRLAPARRSARHRPVRPSAHGFARQPA